MANIKNYGMSGIASDVQFGKSGPRLVNDAGVFKFKNVGGSDFVNLQAKDLLLTGDLTVQGATTTIETQTLKVEDKNIEIGVTYDGSHVEIPATDAGADGGGITLKGDVDKTLEWLISTGAWTSSEHFDLATGKSYYVDGSAVLSKTVLGSTVVTSSLTTVGTLTGLAVAASSTIDFGSNKLTNVANGSSNNDAVNFSQLSSALSDVSDNLDAAIAQEVTDRNSAISTAIATEVTNRDSAISTAVAAEATRAGGVESGLQSELDATQTGAGLSAAGAYVVLTGSNYLTSATSIANATSLLDGQLKTLADEVAALGSGSITDLQNEVDAIEASLGSMVGSDGVWVGFTGTNYLGSVEDATLAFTTLDGQLKIIADDLSDEATARDNAIAAAIAQEVTDRNSAISTAIATEVTNRNSAISTAIATEVTNRNTAIGVETTRAEGAESALGTRIDDLTTDEVAEGTTNKYFSDTLARGALSIDATTGHTGLEYNSTTGVFGIDQTVIATVAYADSGDATTLASANAYTDSQLGSAAVNQAKGVYAAFAYTDSSVTIATLTGRVHRIKVYVDTAFDGTTPSIQVGTDATANLIASTADIDPTGTGVYVVEMNQNIASATALKVFIGGTGATAGAGSVIVEYLG